jgi:hypothetical protein
LKYRPPIRVSKVMERLEDGLDKGWIPKQLQILIEEDHDFGFQRIERNAWDERTANDMDDEAQVEAANTLRKVKKIWRNARVCELQGRDENAWCIDVILPLVKLALKLEGRGKLILQSV